MGPQLEALGQSVKICAYQKIFAVLILGFASGLPLLLIYSTLSLWLRQEGDTLTEIGWFSWAGATYRLKFAWAPLIDHVRIPWLGR